MRAKITIAAMALFAFVTLTHAQPPQGVNYQAVARNTAGTALANQHVGLQFSIYLGAPTGTPVYIETDTATTNEFGLFTVVIGNGTATSGTFAGINWGGGATYLQVGIDPTGGTSYTQLATTQLQSVPYALNAASSSQWYTSISDIYNANTSGSVNVFTSDEDAVNVTGSASNTRPYLAFSNIGNAYRGYIGIWSDTAGLDVGTGSDNTTGNFNLVTQATPRVTVSPTGYVGIGTTTPGAFLDIEQSDNNNTLNLNSPGNTLITVENAGVDEFYLQAYHGAVYLYNYQDSDLSFGTNLNSEILHLQASNLSVGIGTATPAYKLDVAGQVNAAYACGASVYNQAVAVFESTSGSFGRIALVNGAGNSGTVLDGTTSDALNVGNLTGAYAPVNASAFNVNSDITLKKEVEYLNDKDLNTCLGQIRNVQSIRFRYNTESATQTSGMQYRPFLHLGVVAQSLPDEVVAKMDLTPDGTVKGTKLGLSLADMSGLLIAGVKALDSKQTESDAKQAQLYQQIQQQQQQIADLQKLVENLSNKLGNK